MSEAAPCSSWITRHLDAIQNVVRLLCRRKSLSPEDCEDFESDLLLRLAEDETALSETIRNAPAAFFHTLAANLFVDRQREQSGRWQPSTSAKQHGESALLLERLLHLERLTVSEAFHVLTINYRLNLSLPEYRSLLAVVQLPKTRESIVEFQEERFSNESNSIEEARKLALRRLILADVGELAEQFAPEATLVVKLRYLEDVSISEIARVLRKERHQIRYLHDQTLLELKNRLLERGFTEVELLEVIR